MCDGSDVRISMVHRIWPICSQKPFRRRGLGAVMCGILVTLAAAMGCKTHDTWSVGRQTGEFHLVAGQGITNFYLLGGTVYSGSAPEGEEGFRTLQRLGVKTIITVDGTLPDVEMAARHGMRYVHLPIGYDGTSRSNALRIVKAADVMPGPVFVHCHHGQHRGPTAAALICEGLHGWSPEQSELWLKAAGTATNYPGLYRTVRDFRAPNAKELRTVPTEFPSRAKTPDLVQTMVQVDKHFNMLKALEKSGFKPMAEHPDVTVQSETLAIEELFREAHRTGQGAERGATFEMELAKAEGTADKLRSAVSNYAANSESGREIAKMAMQNMSKNCIICHKAYRN